MRKNIGRLIACAAAVTMLLSACEPLPSRDLFPGQSPTASLTDTQAAATTPSLSVSPDASASPSGTPASTTPGATPASSASATPTPSPTPAPRFTLAENVAVAWDGTSKYAYTLIRSRSALDEAAYLSKLLGANYKAVKAPSLTMRAFENGTKALTVTKYTYLYQDTGMMNDMTPMPVASKTAKEIVDYVTEEMKDIFPEEMLQTPLITDTANYSTGAVAVTVQYARSINGALIDDNMEGVTVTLGALGVRDLHFQWCNYSEGMSAHPTDIGLAVQQLNRDYAGGGPVSIIKAELVYKPGSMGVDYTLYWRFTGGNGEVFDLPMG